MSYSILIYFVLCLSIYKSNSSFLPILYYDNSTIESISVYTTDLIDSTENTSTTLPYEDFLNETIIGDTDIGMIDNSTFVINRTLIDIEKLNETLAEDNQIEGNSFTNQTDTGVPSSNSTSSRFRERVRNTLTRLGQGLLWANDKVTDALQRAIILLQSVAQTGIAFTVNRSRRVFDPERECPLASPYEQTRWCQTICRTVVFHTKFEGFCDEYGRCLCSGLITMVPKPPMVTSIKQSKTKEAASYEGKSSANTTEASPMAIAKAYDEANKKSILAAIKTVFNRQNSGTM